MCFKGPVCMDLMNAVRAKVCAGRARTRHGKTSFIGFDVLDGDIWRSTAVETIHKSLMIKAAVPAKELMLENSHHTSDIPAADLDPRAWTRILAKYREPCRARSVIELVITVVPLVLLWVLMWATGRSCSADQYLPRLFFF